MEATEISENDEILSFKTGLEFKLNDSEMPTEESYCILFMQQRHKVGSQPKYVIAWYNPRFGKDGFLERKLYSGYNQLLYDDWFIWWAKLPNAYDLAVFLDMAKD